MTQREINEIRASFAGRANRFNDHDALLAAMTSEQQVDYARSGRWPRSVEEMTPAHLLREWVRLLGGIPA